MEKIELKPDILQQFKAPQTLELDVQSNLRINNVLSINRQGELPARFLSGLLPTFLLSQAITELSEGRMRPEIRIFQPFNIFCHTNGVTTELAQRQIAKGQDILLSFQQNFFPDTILLLENDEKVNVESIRVLEQVKRGITIFCDPEVVEAIRESGEKHGGTKGAENSLIYAAHHPFGWNDLHHSEIFQSTPPSTLINTLPPSEKKFNVVRDAVNQHIEGEEITVFEGTTHELTINMSGTPHYMFVENEIGEKQEPAFSEIESTPVTEVITDIQNRFANEKDKFLKEKLRRVRGDFNKLLQFLTNDSLEERGNESLTQLLSSKGGSL